MAPLVFGQILSEVVDAIKKHSLASRITLGMHQRGGFKRYLTRADSVNTKTPSVESDVLLGGHHECLSWQYRRFILVAKSPKE
jgi:hypothetical protein